jgi:transcriptional regulator
MFIAPVDATLGETEWRPFVEAHPFGHLVVPGGPARELPVVVPTQFVLADDTVWLHLVRANPVFEALAENPRVILSVADDWAFIPSSWKVVGDEDPALGIPTTYYGAVQLVGTATVHDERSSPGSVVAILRRQLAVFQPGDEVADPGEAHATRALGILGIEISVEKVSAKFKYGGNVDARHRRSVVERLRDRGGPGDDAAAWHVVRRLEDEMLQAQGQEAQGQEAQGQEAQG